MGKPTGFLEWQRVPLPRRDRRERVRDSREIYLPRAEEESRRQAGRCMDCGVPFCQSRCPLGNVIPDWNHLVYRLIEDHVRLTGSPLGNRLLDNWETMVGHFVKVMPLEYKRVLAERRRGRRTIEPPRLTVINGAGG